MMGKMGVGIVSSLCCVLIGGSELDSQCCINFSASRKHIPVDAEA
jgi:hypothetical protein